jgi:hypothetical protein
VALFDDGGGRTELLLGAGLGPRGMAFVLRSSGRRQAWRRSVLVAEPGGESRYGGPVAGRIA